MQATTVAAETNGPERRETNLFGNSISPGWGGGRAWIPLDILRPAWEDRHIKSADGAQELTRIQVAVRQTRLEVEESARRIEEQLSGTLADIFRAHGRMLDELLSSGEFEQEVRASLVDAPSAVRRVFRRWHEKFSSLKVEAFQQRADDVADLGRKILGHLEGEPGPRVKNLPPGSVLVVKRLLPSDVVILDAERVAAVIVESLGQGSHAALLAREKGIPTVAEFPGIVEQIHPGDELFVDAYHGQVIIWPQADTQAELRERLGRQHAAVCRGKESCHQPAVTLDGQRVLVEANIGCRQDAQMAADNGADGVGLLRIEQIYLARELPPTADELLAALRDVTAPLRASPVTIRLLDVGADKPAPFLRLPLATNPALGSRGVRLLLEYPQLARTQLTALLRLSQEQDIRVLIPLVTLEEDIRQMRELFDQMLAEMAITRRPAFGAMVETPAAALNLAAIGPYVDFFSVGTNDLTQYTLAVARDDPAVHRYYLQGHASLLRLLEIIRGEAGSLPVTICGELAAHEEVIPRLLALGYRGLSTAPPLIPAVKQRVRESRVE